MEKWALITGASSGIGAELAKLYAKRGYNLALTARRTDRLYKIASAATSAADDNIKTRIITCDISDKAQCRALYASLSDLKIDLLINCAGFGAVGVFDETDIDRQLEMIDVNCASLTLLTHLFLQDFKKCDSGAILNVASSAGLLPGGPNMAVYYATKAYVISLTNAIHEELSSCGSSVKIAALCPGPVNTEFDKVANVRFSLKGISARYCAKCAAMGLDKGKRIIIPESKIKALCILSKFAPENIILHLTAKQQKKKI